ncbi:MAG: hypothetical protein ACREDT_03085 [Methylocella sp.]
MTIPLIWCLLLGAILGRFFKVLVLVPACAFILAAVLARSAAVEQSLLHPLIECAGLNASLQIGFLSGQLSFFIPGFIPGVSQRQGSCTRARSLLRQ